MSVPEHKLLLYDKPRQGTTFIRQIPVYAYRHRKVAIGGDDSASCILFVSYNEAEWWYENALGNSGRFFVDDPMMPVWDGYVNRVTMEVGGYTFTRSLDDMFNRTTMDYYNQATAALAVTATINDTASQTVYGLKQGQIAGEIEYGTGSSRNAIRQILATQYAWPQVSFSQGGGAVAIKLELLGWYHVWEWEIYESTNTTDVNADVALLRTTVTTTAEAPTNAPFIYATGAGGAGNTWSQYIAANAGFTINRESTNGRTYWDFISEITSGGDGTNPWVVGITRPNALDATRYVYYRAARSAVAYYQRIFSEPGVVRDQFDRKVSPWRMEADRSIQVSDVLFAWDEAGQDPRATYIEALEYDGDTQTVTYQGGDNINPLGIFGLNRRFKTRGRGVNKFPPRDRL